MRCMTKGKLFLDSVGRLYFDTCKSDAEHILAPTPEGEERRNCRLYLEDIFSGFIGKEAKDWEVGLRILDTISKPEVQFVGDETPGKVEMEVAIPEGEILDELNALTGFLYERGKELPEFEQVRKHLAQFFAMGALFYKELSLHPSPKRREDLANVAFKLAGALQEED